jgi:hypothetical protein
MKLTFALTLGLLALFPHALFADDHVQLSVGSFLRSYTGEEGVPIAKQKAESIVRMKFADGYLAGVTDSSFKTAWCNTTGVPRPELKAAVVAALRALPPIEQQGPAASAIVHALRTEFPCKR